MKFDVLESGSFGARRQNCHFFWTQIKNSNHISEMIVWYWEKERERYPVPPKIVSALFDQGSNLVLANEYTIDAKSTI